MRLAELQTHFSLTSMAEDLLKVAATRCVFLDYRPSLIAAAAFVMAASLCELKKHPKISVTQVLRLKSTKQPPTFLEAGISFWDEELSS